MNSTDGLSCQRVRACPSNPNVPVTAGQSLSFFRARMLPMNKIESAVLSSSADPLARGMIVTFHEGFFDSSDQFGIAPDLNASLMLLKDRKAPALFLFRDMVLQCQRVRIGPPGILEAEQ